MTGQGIGGLLANQIQTADRSPLAPGRRGEAGTSRNADAPFSGFLRTLIDAADQARQTQRAQSGRSGVSREGHGRARPEADARPRGLPEGMSGREREVLDRVAMLVADGSLPSEAFESMDADAFRDLAAWVLAGAGGMFPPMSGVDAGALFAGMEMEPGSILNRMGMGLAEGVKTGPADEGGENGMSRLAGLMGLGSLEPEARSALLAALADGVDVEGGAKAGSVWEAVKGMPTDTLSALLQEAMAAAGLETDAVEGLPDLALRGLVVELLDGEEGLEGAGGRSILGDLMRGTDATRFGGKGEGESETPHARARRQGNGLDAKNGDGKPGGADIGALEFDPAAEGDAEGMASTESALRGAQNGAASAGNMSALAGQETAADGMPLFLAEEEPPAGQAVAGTETNRIVVAPDAPVMAADARPIPVDVPVSTADMLENIERIEQVMRVATRQNGVQHVTLQLSPPHLGRMSLSVEMRAGVLTATLRTESVDARNLVLAGIEQLRKNLEVQGVQLEGFDVSVDHGEAQNQEAWQHAQDEQQAAFRRRANRVGVAETGTEAQRPVGPGRVHGGGMGDGSVNIVA